MPPMKIQPSRRDFVVSALGAMAAISLPQTTPQAGSRTLLKGGRVLTIDAGIGDFEKADVLIEGAKIAAVQPNIKASAKIIDASNMIVMPGFIDTHRHAWQAALRNTIPNGLLSDYIRDILITARPAYRPEDVYIGDLVCALGAINAGVTTL